jgi:hypothetical protein
MFIDIRFEVIKNRFFRVFTVKFEICRRPYFRESLRLIILNILPLEVFPLQGTNIKEELISLSFLNCLSFTSFQ